MPAVDPDDFLNQENAGEDIINHNLNTDLQQIIEVDDFDDGGQILDKLAQSESRKEQLKQGLEAFNQSQQKMNHNDSFQSATGEQM